mmetsp:Transcript_23314/g.50275  ORF Transcript_23314/g.50275 Transcript_23314/m.50275 type:complete len:195 (-) Transcript_23314:318-902(-)
MSTEVAQVQRELAATQAVFEDVDVKLTACELDASGELAEVHAQLCESVPLLVQQLRICQEELQKARLAGELQNELAQVQSKALANCHRSLCGFRDHSFEARAYLVSRERLCYEEREALESWWAEETQQESINLLANGQRKLLSKATPATTDRGRRAWIGRVVRRVLVTSKEPSMPQLPAGFRRCGPNGMFTIDG